MKKKFLAMLLALTMALSLAACGGDSGTEEPSGSEDAGISAETVKIASSASTIRTPATTWPTSTA